MKYFETFRIMLVGFFKKYLQQLFFDLSGYSDISVGCAKLFGIDLTENFKYPYKSKSIKDFWNRLHISLSCWLRDYIRTIVYSNITEEEKYILFLIGLVTMFNMIDCHIFIIILQIWISIRMKIMLN